MKLNEEETIVQKFKRRSGDTRFLGLNILFLWIGLVIIAFQNDVQHSTILDFINQQMPSYTNPYVNWDINNTVQQINLSEIERLDYGR